MGIKTYKPITPGLRTRTTLTFEELTRDHPEKGLLAPLPSTGGRNNLGRMTARHRGGRHKRRYRIIDFRRDKVGVPAKVAAIEYDPNRSAHIALLHYVDGEKRYILWPEGLRVGDVVQSGPHAAIRVGNALPLEAIPIGTTVHNIELRPGKGGQLARSAGCSAQVVAREGAYVHVRLSSGEVRRIHGRCMATIGQVGNADHFNITLGKAGRSRWLGRRPHTRGVAMNPVDHPLGGGEGKSHGGRHPCSPWGQLAKGYRTRRNRATDKYIVKWRK